MNSIAFNFRKALLKLLKPFEKREKRALSHIGFN